MRGMSPESFRVVPAAEQPCRAADFAAEGAVYVHRIWDICGRGGGGQCAAVDTGFDGRADGGFDGGGSAGSRVCVVPQTGRKLALVGLNHRVHNVLHLTGIAPLFDTYDSVSAAEAGLA